MSEIDKAIEYLALNKECLETELKGLRTKAYMESCKNHIDYFEKAIKALQEKQERDKGCKNCRWFENNWCTEVMARPIKPTDFCSYFEPKKE